MTYTVSEKLVILSALREFVSNHADADTSISQRIILNLESTFKAASINV